MSDEKKEPPKFKNKAERNAGYVTDAMRIFKDKQLLNERPETMSREEYQILRKMQTLLLKQLFHKGKSPSRKLSGLMGRPQTAPQTMKGVRRMVKQRKAS